MELKNKKIAFLGDSITQGCNASTPDNFYWNVVARETGAISFGYGIGGMSLKFGKVTLTEIAAALILGIITNVILSGKKKNSEEN